MNLAQIIVKPVLTEKSVRNSSFNKYTFVVNSRATKIDVKNAIQVIYGAKVDKVNMVKNHPKFKVGKGRKLMQKRDAQTRAIVTLKKGEKLELSKPKTKAPKKKETKTTK
jgi:large subunit ribosomal protein L23